MANYISGGVYTGLGTFKIGVGETGNYKLYGTITLPTIPEGEAANSQVVVTININGGSTLFTGNPGDKGFQLIHSATANDIFNVILTSAAAVDQPLNEIKTTISLSEI